MSWHKKFSATHTCNSILDLGYSKKDARLCQRVSNKGERWVDVGSRGIKYDLILENGL